MRFYSDSAIAKEQASLALRGESDGTQYCYRCFDCHRIITKLEMIAGRIVNRPNTCPCGSRKVTVANPTLWEELTRPRIWKLFVAIKRKRVSPPPTPLTQVEQKQVDRKNRVNIREFERKLENTR